MLASSSPPSVTELSPNRSRSFSTVKKCCFCAYVWARQVFVFLRTLSTINFSRIVGRYSNLGAAYMSGNCRSQNHEIYSYLVIDGINTSLDPIYSCRILFVYPITYSCVYIF